MAFATRVELSEHILASREPLVTVAVLTRNGGHVCIETIGALLRQEAGFAFEVLVIDTASSDGTPSAIRSVFDNTSSNPWRVPLQLKHISRREFSHGGTRNLAAGMARGEFVVFLSQDATPTGKTWLQTMIRPFDDPEVVASFCRQVPKPGARLPERVLLGTAYPATPSTRSFESVAMRSATYILFSNAASAVRRVTLRSSPFDSSLMMCEDADWAVRVLSARMRIAYVTNAFVVHSHFYTLSSTLRRQFDIAVSVRHLPHPVRPASYIGFVQAELKEMVRQKALRELPRTIAVEALRVTGHLLGTHHDRLPTWLTTRLTAYPDWMAARQRRKVFHLSRAKCENRGTAR